MIDFFSENIATIIVGLIVLAIVLLIIFKLIKDKKKGKSSCGCGCEHCQNASACHDSVKK